MALTNAQMRDRVYLQNMLSTLNRLKTNGLRAAETTSQKNARLLTHMNARNGINGGAEETSYVRLLQDKNSAVNSINAQYDPQIAEVQGALDILNARRSSGGRGRTQMTTTITPLTRQPAATYKAPSIGVGGMATGGASRIPINYRQRYTR